MSKAYFSILAWAIDFSSCTAEVATKLMSGKILKVCRLFDYDSISYYNIDRILEQNPESVLAWVKNTLSPQTTAPEDFNWLLLADVSSAKARKGENNAGLFDRTWAEVATAIYDRLAEAAQQKKPGSGESVRISSMMLRAGAIATISAL